MTTPARKPARAKRAIHKELERVLAELGMKPAELARQCGVTKYAAYRWLDGTSAPRGWLLPKISKATKVSVDQLHEWMRWS